jgi:predicted anti-sigma-YlaC factor YlaD
MSECHWLSDRMPAVALGTAEWSPDEVQHLETCQSCQEEWNLVGRSSRMGREVGLSLEAASTSEALLQRLERARLERLRSRAWSFAGLAAAATIAAVVWTGRPATRSTHPAPAIVAGLQMSLPELDSLQPAELDSVLQTMDDPAPADSTLDELEGFLDSWEG